MTILKTKSQFLQFVILFFLGIVVTVISSPIVALAGSKLTIESNPAEFSAFIVIVFVGPFIETFLNQYLVFKVAGSKSFLARRPHLIILVSAISFGILHFYSLAYIIWAFSSGFTWHSAIIYSPLQGKMLF